MRACTKADVLEGRTGENVPSKTLLLLSLGYFKKLELFYLLYLYVGSKIKRRKEAAKQIGEVVSVLVDTDQ
jgi:hypothetical protein